MTKVDAPVLAARLACLAEVYERRPVTPAALEVWFETLKEFATEQVLSILIGWPKTHTKFPAPADVWKDANERAIEQRSRKALLEKREEFFPGVGGARAQEFIASIREILNKPKWSPMEHWQWVLANHAPGSIGHRYAQEVLEKAGRLIDRQDEERQAVNL